MRGVARAGRIARVRGHADRRVVTLHSTAAVHEAAGSFFAPLQARLGAVLSHYSADQLDLVEDVVRALRETTDAYAPVPDRHPLPDAPLDGTIPVRPAHEPCSESGRKR